MYLLYFIIIFLIFVMSPNLFYFYFFYGNVINEIKQTGGLGMTFKWPAKYLTTQNY